MELPEPLLTFDLYETFLDTHRFEKQQQLEQVKATLAYIPPFNYKLLQYLCAFLKQVKDRYRVNKMSASSLANVFGPTLLSPLAMSQVRTISSSSSSISLFALNCLPSTNTATVPPPRHEPGLPH